MTELKVVNVDVKILEAAFFFRHLTFRTIINFESEKIRYLISFQKKKRNNFYLSKYKLIFIFTLWNEADTIR